MNALRRAIAAELLSSSSSSFPTKSSLLLTRLQEPSCLYSTATANSTSPSKSTKKKQVGTKKTTTKLPIPLARLLPQPPEIAELQKKLADLQKKKTTTTKPSPSKTTHKENPPQLPRTLAVAARQLLAQPPENQDSQKGEGGYRKDLPRPREMTWKKKEANTVNLIGRIQIPVQFEASSDGNFWGGTILSQGNEGNSAFWIPIIFKGDLAHIAACHLKPTDYVHIVGEICSDPPPFDLKEGQGSVQVMVHDINFVDESSQAKNTVTSENPEELDKFGTSSSVIETKSDGDTASKFPDFEHGSKHTDLGIKETPEWALAILDGSQVESEGTVIKGTLMPPNPIPKQENEGDNLWNDLVKNPYKWWDNRNKKVNPKAPDFVHKDTKVGLWLNRCPPSLRSSLPPSGSQVDVQIPNPTPKEEIKATPKKESEGDSSWKDLVENPNKWWDNRKKKVNPKAPDFVHKDTREALWINRCPPSLMSSLPPSGSQVDAQLRNPTPKEEIKATPKKESEGEDSWKDLVENPYKWWDNREKKVNPKAPDFKHKDTKVGLWLNSCPPWLMSSLPPPREGWISTNSI